MKAIFLTAVLAFGCAGTTQAASSVTLYGIADAGLAYHKVSGTWDGLDYDAKKVGIISGGQSGSRWGIKGSEAIGDGVKAVFQLESGFDLATGRSAQGGRLFGRQATVGLASDKWGKLEFGRQSNIASKFGNPVVDPFDAAFQQAAAGTTFSAMNTPRYDNMAMYRSANISGFEFGVGYSFSLNGEQHWEINNNETEDGKALTAGLRYTRGPISAFAAYDQIVFDDSDTKFKSWSVGAAYDFRFAKLSLAYGQTKDGWFAGRNFGTLGTGAFVTADGLDVNSYLIGLTAPLGNGMLRASVQMADPKSGAQPTAARWFAGPDLERMTVYSLGYTYSLSKRTNVYAYGSYAKHALFQENLKSTLLSVGVRHRF